MYLELKTLTCGPFKKYRMIAKLMPHTGRNIPLVMNRYCKFSRGLYFRETSHTRSFVKIKYSRNGEISLSFTDIGESCPSHEF